MPRAAYFAMEHGKPQVAGSDSHVLSTLGRCVNLIESENNLDDVLHSMKHGRISVSQTGYAMQSETLESPQIQDKQLQGVSWQVISLSTTRTAKWLLTLLLRIYEKNQNSPMWSLFYAVGVYLMRRISQKINFQHHDPGFMKDRDLGTMFRMAL